MLCSNCKTPLAPDAQLCASCGQKIKRDPGAPKEEMKKKRPSGMEKVLFSLVGMASAAFLLYTVAMQDDHLMPSKNSDLYLAVNTAETRLPEPSPGQPKNMEEIESLIEGQLTALKDDKVEKAYNEYATKEFKAASSLDFFRRFVRQYPILTKYKDFTILEASEENDKQFAMVELKDDKGEVTYVQYTLAFEGNVLKVQGMRIDPGGKPAIEGSEEQIQVHEQKKTVAKTNDPKIIAIVSVTNGQLDALKSNLLSKAYYDFTSKEFRKETTFDDFKKTMGEHSIFTNRSQVEYDYTNAIVDNNHASITAILKKNGEKPQVDFALIKEDNSWKIWGEQIENVAEGTTSEASDTDKKGAIDTVQGQLKELRAKNFSKAYNDYTSPEFRQATDLQAFEAFVNSYPILTKHQTVAFGEVIVRDGKANVTGILKEDKVSNPIEFTLVKQNGEWRIFGLRLLIPEQALSSSEKGDIQAVISEQLAALRDNDLDKAYSFTSKEFRQAATPEVFAEFMKQHTIFRDHTSASFGEAKQETKNVVIVTTLTGPNQSAEVEYRLAKDNGTWKIWSMSLKRNSTAASRPASIKSADLIKTIEDMMSAIRGQDYRKAYENYASQGFKEVTSLQTFEQFVEKNPVILKNKAVNLSQLTFENDIASYEGTVESSDGDSEKVKFRLVYEDGSWKVLSINILYSLDQQDSTHLEFTKAMFGTDVDLQGKIINPTTHLKVNDSKITANIYVSNGTKDTNIEVVLEHVETSSKINPVSTELVKDGDSVVSFIFSAPSQGWPKGNYKLYATSSNGAQGVFNFTIE